MSVSSISNSLNGLFTGVGGVSGAGGGYNSASIAANGAASGGTSAANMITRRMLANLANMSRQQQQQTLIYLLEQLITLNHELQRTEAAMGVLDFASKYLQSLDSQTRVKERWYEKLHQWQKALAIYERELKKNGGVQSAVKRTATVSTSSSVNSANQSISDTNSSEAFTITNVNEITEPRLDLLMGRMRCLKGLGEWRGLVYSCSDLYQTIDTLQRETSTSNSRNALQCLSGGSGSGGLVNQFNPAMERIVPINSLSGGLPTAGGDQQAVAYMRQLNSHNLQQLKEKVAEMGAAACWGLGDWKQMHTFVECLPETTYDGSLYRSVLALSSDVSLLLGPTDQSMSSSDGQTQRGSRTVTELIEQTRDLLDVDLTSMATQSYERSYQAIIEAQVLAELEEIVKYKKIPGKRDWLMETWWKRLQGKISFKSLLFVTTKSIKIIFYITQFRLFF